MPRVRYLKPTPEAHAYAAHVLRTADEASSGHDYVVTHLAPSGEVALEIVQGTDGVVGEVFIGRRGQVSSDAALMELASEAVDEAQEAAAREAVEVAERKAAARAGGEPPADT